MSARKTSQSRKSQSRKRATATGPTLDAELVAQLIKVAHGARENAYAPYSNFRVGAAIITAEGHVFAGCNVENAAFPSGICAERGAISSMIAAGDRNPIACVIVTGGTDPAPPCGMCRQVLVEFARTMPIILVGVDEARGLRSGGKAREVHRTLDLATLIPEVFVLKKSSRK